VPRDLDRGAELTGDVVSDAEGPGSAHRAQDAGLLVMGQARDYIDQATGGELKSWGEESSTNISLRDDALVRELRRLPDPAAIQ